MTESRKIEFPGAAGAICRLASTCRASPRAFALFAHCFTCGKDIFAASRIAEGLASRGIAVLRFDFTGIGSSEGEFANTNFSSNVARSRRGREIICARPRRAVSADRPQPGRGGGACRGAERARGDMRRHHRRSVLGCPRHA